MFGCVSIMNAYLEKFYPLLSQPIVASLQEASLSAEQLCASGTVEDFATLGEFRCLKSLLVDNLNLKTLPFVTQLKNIECLVLRRYGAKDFSGFSQLKTLRHLMVWQSPKVKSLSGLENKNLASLYLMDVGPITDLRPITTISELVNFRLSGGFWKKHALESLAPLTKIANLRWLELCAVQIVDNDLSPLTHLPDLEHFELSSAYPLECLAPIAARFPHLYRQWLEPQGDSGLDCKKCRAEKLRWLAGNQSKMVCPSCDKEKILNFQKKFRALVEAVKQ